MNNGSAITLMAAMAACSITSFATAGGPIVVNSDITVSTTWTADNVYDLAAQIYVTNGATLTIEPGTLIASTPTGNGSGSLAINRGSRIIAKGTCDDPIIFTSSNDDFTTWREAANEWGNLTIQGRGYIGFGPLTGNGTPVPTNVSTCGDNVSAMEGLTESFPGDPRVLYGGTDDDDNSGCLEYVSIRYGGRVIGLGNELNGLSLGGIGRGTSIRYIEIMNNVDDGIEIWGGTVYLKYFSIWNVGDDSFDVDQGWRGCAQFGLIVQGYSLDASQGSGVGDNAFETDGSENSFEQPLTTATIYNATVIGQPIDGDGATTWRDNARVQYRQCVFMDIGERVVRFDDSDGDGSDGYGAMGTTSWADTWTTSYTVTEAVNACADPAARYTAQSAGNAPGQGFLAEITDSVFFNNNASDAYTESDARGVTINGGSNPAKANVVSTVSPVVCVDRADAVQRGGKFMVRVIGLDPRAAGDAVSSVGTPPAGDDFFCLTDYRGAFAPDENPWICKWTAADQYGFLKNCAVAQPCPWDCAPDGGNGTVNIDDLLRVINEFGQPGGACDNAPDNGDGTFGNGIINIDDLLGIINNFGDCP